MNVIELGDMRPLNTLRAVVCERAAAYQANERDRLRALRLGVECFKSGTTLGASCRVATDSMRIRMRLVSPKGAA